MQMFILRSRPAVAIDGGVGCFLETEGSCQGHPKGGDLPWCWEGTLKGPHLAAESPQASARPQIQEKEATSRQMPWNARRWFVGLRASDAAHSHLSWAC